MYYVYVALYGYRQLKVVNATVIDELEQRLRDIIRLNGGHSALKHPYLIELPSQYLESSIIALECAFEIHALLQEYRGKHIGATVLIGQAYNDILTYFNRLHSFVDYDDQVWLDEASLPTWAAYIDYEVHHQLVMIKSLRSTLGGIEQAQLDNLLQPVISHTLKKYRYGVSSQRLLLFYGARGWGKRYSLEESLQRVRKNEGFDFARIDATLPSYHLLSGFTSIFCPVVLKMMSEEIGGEDTLIWQRLEGFFHFIQHPQDEILLDQAQGDLTAMCREYFKSYRKYCRDNLLPPWVIVYYSEHFVGIRQALFSVILKVIYESGLSIVVLEDKLVNFPYYEVESYKVQPVSYYYSKQQGLSRSKHKKSQMIEPYAAILIEWLMNQGQKVEHGVEIAQLLLLVMQSFDTLTLRTLFQVTMSKGLFEIKELIDSLELDGQGRRLVYKRLRSLEKLGIIQRRVGRAVVLYAEIEQLLPQVLGVEFGSYQQQLCRYLLKYGKASYLQAYMIENLEAGDFIDEGLLVLHNYLHYLLDIRNLEQFNNLELEYFNQQELSHTQRAALKTIIYTIRLRAMTLENYDLTESISMLDDLPYVEASDNLYVNFYLLQKYRLEAKNHKVEEHLEAKLKRLTFAFQKSSEHRGEALSNYELAYVTFKQGKSKQALEFCEIALRLFDTFKFTYGELMALSLQSLIAFTAGNLSAAMNYSQQGVRRAMSVGNHQRLWLMRFVQSRIDFELGRYEQALKRLQEDAKMAYQYQQLEVYTVLRSWIFRCYCHLGEKEKALDIYQNSDKTLELEYFYALMCVMQEEYELGLEVLEASYSWQRDDYYTISEDEQWHDGFHVIEGQRSYVGVRSVLRMLSDELYLYLAAKCTEKGLRENKTESLEALRLACDLYETQSERPYNYLLPFFYADVVHQENEDLFVIAINRSLRIAMSWVNRIFDIRVKNDYLKDNFWIKNIQKLKKD